MTFSAMKNRARLSLENRWGQAIGGTALVFSCLCLNAVLCFGVESLAFGHLYRLTLQLLLLCGSSVFLLVLMQGQEAWRLDVIGRKPFAHRRIRFWLAPKQCVKVIALHLLVLIRKIAWTALLLPGGIMLYVASRQCEIGTVNRVFWLGGAISFTVGCVFWFCAIQRYAVCRLLLTVMPSMKIRQAIRESVRLMQGKCWNLVRYRISFLPWWISCVTIVSAFYVIPFYAQSVTLYRYRLLQNKSVP